jgi:hypothetical protein
MRAWARAMRGAPSEIAPAFRPAGVWGVLADTGMCGAVHQEGCLRCVGPRKLLLHFRRTVHPWTSPENAPAFPAYRPSMDIAGKCSCISGIPSIHGHKKTRRGGFLCWCPKEDSNLHDLRRYHLKVVRLPIPPSGLVLTISSPVCHRLSFPELPAPASARVYRNCLPEPWAPPAHRSSPVLALPVSLAPARRHHS